MHARAPAVRILISHQSLSTFEDQSWKGIIKTQDILTWNVISRFLLLTWKKKMQLPRCWELNHKEDWASKNWCFWTVVLEKTLESPLDYKEIKLVNPKRNQSWIFIKRTDAEAEASILWSPDAKSWVTGKDPDAGKDWRQEGKGMTEDEMVEWHHRLNGHVFEQALGVGDGQGGLACCIPWGCKESDATEWLNNNQSAPFWDAPQDIIGHMT